MDNSEQTSVDASASSKPKLTLIIALITLVVFILIAWQLSSTSQEEQLETTTKSAEKVSVVPETKKSLSSIEETKTLVLEPEIMIPKSTNDEDSIDNKPQSSKPLLPSLDESDEWVQKKIPQLTWRKELLSLIITEDMIRRFVVFTDNFSQGLLAYEHTPFVRPNKRLAIDETITVFGEPTVWAWDNKTSKRFDVYVDLLRSVNSSTLVDSYFEFKPLIDEAYRELGYEDDFNEVLNDAIKKVLDMDLPQSSMNLTRTSVMYKFNDPELESLPDSDKLLLRIGKENLLIIKSLLLEINEKLLLKNSQ
jgi:hypothetical protein